MPLNRRLVVNSTPYETRAALLEDGVVVEVYIERTQARGVVGNIYKGRVRKVLPGMQSAFVDIGLDKDAFLYVTDVAEPVEEGWLTGDSLDEPPLTPVEVPPPSGSVIEDLLREGDEVVVQVAKEPIAGKGARVTTHVTLPGRYLVYMPTLGHVGVSRRIDSEPERARLKEIVEGLRASDGSGYIIRTAGEGRLADDFAGDSAYLRQLWQSLLERVRQGRAPTLVHAELGVLDKLLRDVVAGDFGAIVVDSEPVWLRCREFLQLTEPSLVGQVELHRDPVPVFDAHGVESEIEKALHSRIWLKSGGYIVINQTEALVAIDVNTGRYVGRVRLEDTVLRTNLEAVKEIVRQIRLRDLGGIIVVDFIDMEEAKNRSGVVAALEEELRRDRSKSKILQISDFGLVEMTRKRVKRSLERLLLSPCSRCHGSGRVKSAETVFYEIERTLRRMRRSIKGDALELLVHPDVASLLVDAGRRMVGDLERDFGLRIEVRADPGRRVEQYELMVC